MHGLLYINELNCYHYGDLNNTTFDFEFDVFFFLGTISYL